MSAIRRIDVFWAARLASLASLLAQQQVPNSYGPPRLIVAYPTAGASVPSGRPTVMFRYASDEPSDPLDLRSLMILVDSVDRTAHFRATADAAWGPIIDGPAERIAAHRVQARICTVRGACAEVSAIVTVIASGVTTDAMSKDRRGKLIDIVLEAARRLLKP